MGRIARVKNRDGTESPFDEEKIVRSIFQAAREVGKAEMVAARELAGVVTLFLERRHWDDAPGVDDIQDMVERVLLETGHVDEARAYIRARQQWSAGTGEPAGLREGTLFPETKIAVVPPSGEGVSAWDRSRISRALEREAGLPADVSASVAEAVEARILEKGAGRISSRLVRSLVDAELFSRGMHERIRPQAVVGVPGYDLKNWIRGSPHPSDVTRRVAETALREFSFSEVFSREVAAAHAEGRIHVAGAEYPMHLHSVYFPLEFVKRFGSAPASPQDSVVPEDMPSLCEALRKTVAAMSGFVMGSVDVGYVNLMAAPLLNSEDPYQIAGALIGALEVPGTGIPAATAAAEIVGGVPDFLRFTDAVGPGGVRLGRGYGEFWTDAERLARALADAARGRPGAPSFFLHVDRNTFRNPSSVSLLRGLCAEIAKGLPLTFVFEREGRELRLHTRFLTRVEGPGVFRTPESARIPYAQMAVVNAAHAAFRAGRGDIGKFTDELDSALKLAIRAHQDKNAFLGRLADDSSGPYLPLVRASADGKPVLDLSRCEFLVSVNGFPEAVAHVAGGPWSEGGEALKVAAKAASFLSLRIGEEARKAGIRASITGPCPRAAARRLLEADRAAFPDATAAADAAEGYRPGLCLSEDAPDDLLQAVRVVGNLYSLIEPSVTISGDGGKANFDPERLFDLVCEVFERTEMTYLRFREPEE